MHRLGGGCWFYTPPDPVTSNLISNYMDSVLWIVNTWDAFTAMAQVKATIIAYLESHSHFSESNSWLLLSYSLHNSKSFCQFVLNSNQILSHPPFWIWPNALWIMGLYNDNNNLNLCTIISSSSSNAIMVVSLILILRMTTLIFQKVK